MSFCLLPWTPQSFQNDVFALTIECAPKDASSFLYKLAPIEKEINIVNEELLSLKRKLITFMPKENAVGATRDLRNHRIS